MTHSNPSPFAYCLSLAYGERTKFPSIPAVYVAYTPPDIVLYVGRTVGLRNRVMHHVRMLGKIHGARVAWFPLPMSMHKQVERELIKTYAPIFNCHHVPRGSVHVYYTASRRANKIIRQRLSASGTFSENLR